MYIRNDHSCQIFFAAFVFVGHALKSFDSGGKAMCLSDYNIKDRSTLSLDKVATLMRGDKVATLMGGDKVATFMGGAPYTELPVPMAVVLKELSDMFSMVIKEGSKRYIMISNAHFSLFMSVFVFEQTK